MHSVIYQEFRKLVKNLLTLIQLISLVLDHFLIAYGPIIYWPRYLMLLRTMLELHELLPHLKPHRTNRVQAGTRWCLLLLIVRFVAIRQYLIHARLFRESHEFILFVNLSLFHKLIINLTLTTRIQISANAIIWIVVNSLIAAALTFICSFQLNFLNPESLMIKR